MSKKGLLVIYSPQHLVQFLWYYCTFSNNKRWDALCLPNCFGAQNNKNFCEKTGIFENIYYDEKYFLEASAKERFKTFGEMFGAFCIGKKQQYIHRFLSQYVDLTCYDEINVLSDYGVVSGMFVGLSREKKVVIMEDGNSDYKEKTYKNIYRKSPSIINTEGFIMSLLGYANVACFYPLKSTRYCDKYSSRPNLMKYNHYKRNNQLYDFSNTDTELYDTLIKRTYETNTESDLAKADAVLFTTPLSSFTDTPEKYIALINDYVIKNFNSIALKKHPRDKGIYDFCETKCFSIPQNIPSEVFISSVSNKKLVFVEPSSVLLNIPPNSNVECFYFRELHKDSIEGTTYEKYPDFEHLKKQMETFGLENYSIIEL